jgi:hypothetical protein
MPGLVLHLGATVMCAHAGPAQPVAPFPRVTLSGQAVVTLTCAYTITGCGLTGSSPPCVTAQWTVGAVRVTAGGAPVLIQGGQAICAPTGTGLFPVAVQPRVTAT